VCCQVEVSATSWSLVQRSPTECGVSNVCDNENLDTRRPRHPKRGCCAIEKKNLVKRMSISIHNYEIITHF
jgi:hypothetical protein